MVIVFFKCSCILKKKGLNVNAERYSDTLQPLHVSINRINIPESSQVKSFLHDDARPHIAHTVHNLPGRKQW